MVLKIIRYPIVRWPPTPNSHKSFLDPQSTRGSENQTFLGAPPQSKGLSETHGVFTTTSGSPADMGQKPLPFDQHLHSVSDLWSVSRSRFNKLRL